MKKKIVTDLRQRLGSNIKVKMSEITRNLKIQWFENFPLSYGCFSYAVSSKTDAFCHTKLYVEMLCCLVLKTDKVCLAQHRAVAITFHGQVW